MYAAELRPRAKPGYVHSLGCDPVKFSQELGRANLTLAFTQNQRLLASKPTSELTTVTHSHDYLFRYSGAFIYKDESVKFDYPYWYLLLDFHPNSPEFARVRGNIFPYDLDYLFRYAGPFIYKDESVKFD